MRTKRSLLLITKRRTLAAAAVGTLVIAGCGLASAQGASAATAGTPVPGAKGTAGATASPDGVIACSFGVEAPFFLTTTSNKMYASAGVIGCTDPAPSACKLTVDLYASSAVLRVLQTAQSGWVTCNTKLKVTTNKFTCDTTPEKFGFYTQGTLQVEVGTSYDSDIIDSATKDYYCNP